MTNSKKTTKAESAAPVEDTTATEDTAPEPSVEKPVEKFKYTGDCEAGVVKCFGIEFKKGVEVEVPDQFVVGKLSNNSHFERV